jgi:hypothetical protein
MLMLIDEMNIILDLLKSKKIMNTYRIWMKVSMKNGERRIFG